MTNEPTISKALGFIKHCEDVLGWLPNPNPRVPRTQARRQCATRLVAAMKEDPERYTWHNLLLAVELVRREKTVIRSPLYLLHRVDDALKLANAPVAEVPLEEAIRAALMRESVTPDDERSRYWTVRFTRATGRYRREAYDAWLAERGA